MIIFLEILKHCFPMACYLGGYLLAVVHYSEAYKERAALSFVFLCGAVIAYALLVHFHHQRVRRESKASGGKLIMFAVSDELWDKIKHAQELSGIAKTENVFESSLALYMVALENEVEHGRLILEDFEGDQRVVLVSKRSVKREETE